MLVAMQSSLIPASSPRFVQLVGLPLALLDRSALVRFPPHQVIATDIVSAATARGERTSRRV
jgi:hypothetical protein